jgi:hypothetical protein
MGTTGVYKRLIWTPKILYKGKGKGKAIQLQALIDPEDCRRLRLPDFNTIGK